MTWKRVRRLHQAAAVERLRATLTPLGWLPGFLLPPDATNVARRQDTAVVWADVSGRRIVLLDAAAGSTEVFEVPSDCRVEPTERDARIAQATESKKKAGSYEHGGDYPSTVAWNWK